MLARRASSFGLNLRDHRQVLLALVALEPLLERGCGLVGAAGSGEHFGEVAEGIALLDEHIGSLHDLDRRAREPLGFTVVTTVSAD